MLLTAHGGTWLPRNALASTQPRNESLPRLCQPLWLRGVPVARLEVAQRRLQLRAHGRLASGPVLQGGLEPFCKARRLHVMD